jgi:hypothetical protein
MKLGVKVPEQWKTSIPGRIYQMKLGVKATKKEDWDGSCTRSLVKLLDQDIKRCSLDTTSLT